MALTAKSLFLYSLEVNDSNRFLDFRVVALETPRTATLRLGFFSLTSLIEEVVRAMKEVAPLEDFTFSIDRTILGGTQNRVTISSPTAAVLELLFSSGPSVPSTIALTIGFATGVDRTGATSYTGVFSAGIALVPDFKAYNYLGPEHWKQNYGSINISASGNKETIVYSIQEFWQAQFKYIPELKVTQEWEALMRWMIQQRLIEFTPEISFPDVFHEGTLEGTVADGKGLAYRFIEMLPRYPFNYDTGIMKFRVRPTVPQFV